MNMDIRNISELLNRYIDFTDQLAKKHQYPNNIKHVLYLIIPAFVVKYGIKEERMILNCFDNVPIYINPLQNKVLVAYFNRKIHTKEEKGLRQYYTSKEVVLNDYHDTSLIELVDSLVHEFNHAINSIKNELHWNEQEISMRTGLSYITFFRDNVEQVKAKSIDITLEEIINTKQTEDIINIINSFNQYQISNEEFSNTLYALKHDIELNGYHSSAYYFQSYICKELMKNRTFIPTVETLRFQGNVDDVESWFDNIIGENGMYRKLSVLLNEILEDEHRLSKIKNFKKRKIRKIMAKSKEVLDIVNTFEQNCIYK